MMADNPNMGQMSFDDNAETLIRSFERQITTLVEGMQKIVDSNQTLIQTLGKSVPPIGRASSQPQQRPSYVAPGSPTSAGAKTLYKYNPEADVEGPTGFTEEDLRNPQSNDPTNASIPPEKTPYGQYLNNAYNNGGPFQKGLINSVNQGAMQGLRLPRYGEFNTQDILHLIGNAAATGATEIANTSLDENGQFTGEGYGSTTTGKLLNQGLGRVSQVSDYLSNIVPYTRVFSQLTGIPFNLSGQVAEGTQMGYASGGTNIGPFRIPGLDFGTSGIGISPAMQQGMANSLQAFTYGLMPGGSSQLMTQMQNALQQYGWSGSTMRNIAGAWGNVQRSEQYGDIGSPQQLAPILDQMLRQGGGGISNIVTALEALPDAAKAANQSLSQTIDGLNSFAQAQVALGSTYYQGFISGAAIQTSTGLPASVNQSILSSPLGQGFTSEETGVPLPVIGTASVTSQFNGARQALTTLYKSFKGAGWTNQEAAAYAGSVSGMNLNAKQVEDIIKNGGKMASALNLTEQASKVKTKIHNLRNAPIPHSYTAAYNEILKTRGKAAAEMFKKNSLVRGTPGGQGPGFTPEYAVTSKAWHEAEAGGIWGSQMPILRKDALSAGMSTKNFKSMVNGSQKNIDKLDKKIQDWASKRANSYDNTNGQSSVTIELSSQAKKLLQFATSSNKNAANNGQTTVSIPFATSQYPQSGVTANLGTANGNP